MKILLEREVEVTLVYHHLEGMGMAWERVKSNLSSPALLPTFHHAIDARKASPRPRTAWRMIWKNKVRENDITAYTPGRYGMI